MLSTSSESPGLLLQRLLECWHQAHKKRAEGGWWALAGFTFQANVYLLRFFRGLQDKNVEPGALAEMERLSDILQPDDGRLTLTQVKRTLTKGTLTAALKEAYLITGLCLGKTPALVEKLRFQVACRYSDVALSLDIVSMPDVVEAGDLTTWQTMRAAFDVSEPIVQLPDPLDQLHVFLWNVGVLDTTALIEGCAGRLLENFDLRDGDSVRKLGRDLASLFHTAPRRQNWSQIGHPLSEEDVRPDPRASSDKNVLVAGDTPRFYHLKMGMFRDRTEFFGRLWDAFMRWEASLDTFDSGDVFKTPVFWISGRSGEGKSVFLLQLIAEALRTRHPVPFLHLKSGEDLPRLLEFAPPRSALSDATFSRIFAVADDVYDLRDRDDWEECVRNATSLAMPPVAVITCGPTEQQEQFQSRLSDVAEVTHFEIPHLNPEECEAFIQWFEERTGKKPEISKLTTDNPLLVQFMFELAHGESLSAFAKRFKRRLEHLGLFEEARTIIAVTALYLDAPFGLLKSDASRDALERLCREDLLHFRITVADGTANSGGVR